jgi:hypothetical protein
MPLVVSNTSLSNGSTCAATAREEPAEERVHGQVLRAVHSHARTHQEAAKGVLRDDSEDDVGSQEELRARGGREEPR